MILLFLALACNPGEIVTTPVVPSTTPPEAPLPSARGEKMGEEAPTEAPPALDLPEGCHPEIAADPLSADALNTAGYRCYAEGRLADAAGLFRAAVARDETFALAHYNLACTLTLLREKEPACAHGATLDTILDHLERSVALDPGRRKRMREDADLAAIHGTLRYRILDGARLDNPMSLGNALAGVHFYATRGGAFGSTEVLDLLPGGNLVLGTRTFDAAGAPSGWKQRTGTWSLDGVHVVLTPDKGAARTYTVSAEGNLVGDGAVLYTGLPAECAA